MKELLESLLRRYHAEVLAGIQSEEDLIGNVLDEFDMLVMPQVGQLSEVLSIHRWKSMGVKSVECECGEILWGSAEPSPADQAFRDHLASKILDLFLGDHVTPKAVVAATSLQEFASYLDHPSFKNLDVDTIEKVKISALEIARQLTEGVE